MLHTINIYQSDGKTLVAQATGNLKKFPRFHQPLCDEIVAGLKAKIAGAGYKGKVVLQFTQVPLAWMAPVRKAFDKYNMTI